MQDLWPDDFGKFTVVPPVVILREQADLLGKKTKGLITAEVRSYEDNKQFRHKFYLVVPTLGNYSYLLLSAAHDIRLYPAGLLDSSTDTSYECNSEQEFIVRLRAILATEQTKQIVGAILSQIPLPAESA